MAGVSFATEDHVAGGFIEGPFTITKAVIAEFAYTNKDGQTMGKPGVGLLLALTGADGQEQSPQFYSAGAHDRWQPSEDGDELEAIGGQAGLTNTCNMHYFFEFLENAGFPQELLGAGKASALDGLHANWAQREIKRTGGNVKKESSIPIVVDILTLPGEEGDRFEAGSGAKTKRKSSKKAAKKSAAAKPNGADAGPNDEAISTMLLDIVLAEGELNRKEIPGKMLAAGADRAVATRAYQEDFLGQDGAPWKYADGTLSLG